MKIRHFRIDEQTPPLSRNCPGSEFIGGPTRTTEKITRSGFRSAALTLVRANKSRGGGYRSDDDYDVRDGNRVIGRIMLHPQAPKDQPWFWTITARESKPSIYNKGYAATPEQAMAAFKARWEGGELRSANGRIGQ